jgi:hypothetical protein
MARSGGATVGSIEAIVVAPSSKSERASAAVEAHECDRPPRALAPLGRA